MFEPLYTAAEMRAAEERYPNYPDSIPELMERAGTAVAQEAMRAFPDARRFACVCGGGSNGGDGRVAARVLREAGLVADETSDLAGYDVVVDALFGTGFHGEPRPDAAELIERMNVAEAPVVSVDLPSGVDASTGEIAGAAVEADLTVTFHALKVGLVVAPGRFHAGRVVVSDIGLEDVGTEHRRATAALLDVVPIRAPGATKYTAGSVVVVGGHPGMTGAVCLSGLAALRADAGYVTLAVPEETLPVIEGLALEPVKVGWSEDDAVEVVLRAAERARAVAIGPGLGRGDARRALVRELLQRLDVPVVVDADGLFELEPVERSAPLVLTPHAGELARLLDTDSELGRRASARGRADRRGALSGGRPPEGDGHDRRVARVPARSCPTSARRRSRRPVPATSSPASSPRSSPRESSRSSRPPRLRSRTAERRSSPRTGPGSSRAISSGLLPAALER